MAGGTDQQDHQLLLVPVSVGFSPAAFMEVISNKRRLLVSLLPRRVTVSSSSFGK